MALSCNIDERGRKARLWGGASVALGGLALLGFWGIPSAGAGPMAVSLSVLGLGAFMIFEGAKGWCAARALGFRTRI